MGRGEACSRGGAAQGLGGTTAAARCVPACQRPLCCCTRPPGSCRRRCGARAGSCSARAKTGGAGRHARAVAEGRPCRQGAWHALPPRPPPSRPGRGGGRPADARGRTWNRFRPLRSLKISLPSPPAMAAGSGTLTGREARHVRLAWLGSENGSCARAGGRRGSGRGTSVGLAWLGSQNRCCGWGDGQRWEQSRGCSQLPPPRVQPRGSRAPRVGTQYPAPSTHLGQPLGDGAVVVGQVDDHSID